jgi:hypothetical protein
MEEISMSERGIRLLHTADGQLCALIDLFSTCEETALRLPCPGREQLGDGTVAACASHTADNYLRIAAFLRDEDHAPVEHGHRGRGSHRLPSFLRARGHKSRHASARHSPPHDIDRQGLLARLSSGRDAFGALGDLSDQQLDSVPPVSDMKFCDGQRNLEQIVANLLKHQSHQLDALQAAVTSSTKI